MEPALAYDHLVNSLANDINRITDLEALSKVKHAVEVRSSFLRQHGQRKAGLGDPVEFKMGSRFVRGQVKKIVGRDAQVQEFATGRPYDRVPLEMLRVVPPQ